MVKSPENAASMTESAKKTAEHTSATRILVTDCGSTTTKAILFEKLANEWRQTWRGEAPTTVEYPVSDVTVGARNAFRELEEISGLTLLNTIGESPFRYRANSEDKSGIDLYLSTSSAGGGLQMIVMGAVSNMSTQSAERAALGAGAIVLEAFSLDDGRESFERISRVRHLRPDIVLIAGGTDLGNKVLPLELAEILLQADPQPRFGDTLKLPVIFAGNQQVADEVRSMLKERFHIVVVDNIRPTLEHEALERARSAVHDLFLEHVMSHAPGYSELLSWSPRPIEPTPVAVGRMVQAVAESQNAPVLAVDIGGATTDVFSAIRDDVAAHGGFILNRTVSANLGMSYSAGQVLKEAGVSNIARWLPFEIDQSLLADEIRNKMLRPTSIPSSKRELLVEQAVCREALRLSFNHHIRLAVGLSGKKRERSLREMFTQQQPSFAIDNIELIIGSGGVISHAPSRAAAFLMMLDAFEPVGFTRLAVDSIFMLPHLGVLASENKAAALEVLVRDCIVPLGTAIGFRGYVKPGHAALEVVIAGEAPVRVMPNKIVRFPLPTDEMKALEVRPLQRSLDLGNGPGKILRQTAYGGEVGLVIDTRVRPLTFQRNTPRNTPINTEQRLVFLKDWYAALEIPLP